MPYPMPAVRGKVSRVPVLGSAVIQPDPTAGVDAYLANYTVNTNYGTALDILVGDRFGSQNARGLLKFNFSIVPVGAIITSAVLSLYLKNGPISSKTLRVYRMKRVWVEAQATWNIYSTGNGWQSVGGFGVDDCEQVAIGSYVFGVNEANGWKAIPLTGASVAALDLGNGWLLKMDAENNDRTEYWSSDYVTDTSLRPKLALNWIS